MAHGWYKVASAVLGAIIGSACGETVDSGAGGTAGTGAAAGSGGVAGTGGTGLNPSTGGFGPAEYGMPMAHFVVAGTVTAESDGVPLEGIEIRLDETYDSTSTDGNGDFTLSVDSYAFCYADPCDASLTATDVDGPAGGGEFETTTMDFQLQQTEPGDGTWDDGTWEADGVDVSMPLGAGGGGAAGSGSGGGGGA